MRSPMTPQRGQTGPCGHNTVSRYSRAASSSWKIGLRRSILLRAIGTAFQLSGDPIKCPVLRQPDNSLFYYTARLSVVAIVEVIAFFFLNQYRITVADLKYIS